MLTFKEADRLLRYDPKTGQIFWKNDMTTDVKAGDEAGYYSNFTNRRVQISGLEYNVAKVCYLLATGTWPKGRMTYTNKISADTSWDNIKMTGATR